MDEQVVGRGVAATGTGPRSPKRLRRMNPMERTRILPSAQAPVSGVPVEVGLSPVWVSAEMANARRRTRLTWNVSELERWLGAQGLPLDLVTVLPAFAEAVADVVNLDANAYAEILERFYDGELTGDDWTPHMFEAVCKELELLHAELPACDLATEEEVQVELVLYRLTGAWGLDLDDDGLIDALNATENAPNGDHLAALTAFMAKRGQTVTFLTG